MFEKTFQNVAINFDSVNGRTTFTSGDLITGQLSFQLTNETKISYITLMVLGKAEVRWTSGAKRRTTHSARLEFFKQKSTVLEDRGDGTL